MQIELIRRSFVAEVHRFSTAEDRVAGQPLRCVQQPSHGKRSLGADFAPVLPVAGEHADALVEQILQPGRQISAILAHTQQHSERQRVMCEVPSTRILDLFQKRVRSDAERFRGDRNIIVGEGLKICGGERPLPTEPADRVRETWWPNRRTTGDANRRAGFLKVPFDPVLDRKPASALRYHRLVQRVEVKTGRRVGSRGEFLQASFELRRRAGVLRQSALTYGASGSAFVLRQSSSFRRLAGAGGAQQDDATEAGELVGRQACDIIVAGDDLPDAPDVPESHASRFGSAVTGYRHGHRRR